MTQQLTEEIQGIVKKWKDKEGNLIMVLHEIQDLHGYVPRDISLALSQALHIPLARIYEVLTFYNYFKLSAPGKHRISVCLGTACYLQGAQIILDELKEILGIKEGETTKDALFSLDVVRCLGCCGLAPVIMIDDKVYGKVKKGELTGILSNYGKEP